MDDRVEREQEYHDHRYEHGTRSRAAKWYVAAHAARAHYRDLVRHGAVDGDVLEYGCGKGGAAWFLGDIADTITGIDISEVGIRGARERLAQAEERRAVTRFVQMNAEHLGFDEASIRKWATGCGCRLTRYARLRPDVQATGPGLFAATIRR